MNDNDIILFYFETALPLEDAAAVGLDINSGAAGKINISQNPEFAKLAYSTALTAQASKRPISLQLRKSGSYLTIDRIWLDD